MFSLHLERRNLRAILLGLCLWLGQVPLSVADSVTVETSAGRVFTGQIDPKSSHEALQLRSGTADMFIIRAILWPDIRQVRIDGRAISGQEFLRKLDRDGWPTKVETIQELPRPEPPRPRELMSAVRKASFQTQAGEWPPVAALYIEAGTSRWTSGVEQSGVLVRVYPIDAWGNLVPVSGTLEVDLIGQQWAHQTFGTPFPQLARWAQMVDSSEFGTRGAEYRFNYQAYNPEFDLHLGSYGAVHARLSVPGQGVFDDTVTMVELRPFSTMRDRLQKFRGERFFPLENTVRGVIDYSAPRGFGP